VMYLPTSISRREAGLTTSEIKSWEAMVWAWLGLEIAGQATLFVLLLTFLFSRRLKTQRHPVVVNFVVVWLLSTFPSLLLLYGRAASVQGPEPSPTLCLLNAALISGVPPMASAAFLTVVIQLLVMVRTTLQKKAPSRRTWPLIVLLVCPYIIFIGFATLVGAFGFFFPQDVSRDYDVVFCAVSGHFMGESIWGFTSLVVSITFVFQSWIAVILFRNWQSVRGAKVSSEFDTHLIFRAAAFTIYEFFIVGASIVAVFNQNSIPPKFMQATAPLVTFVILASQPDVIFAWLFCFRRRQTMPLFDQPPMSATTLRNSTYTAVEFGAKDPVFSYKFPLGPGADAPSRSSLAPPFSAYHKYSDSTVSSTATLTDENRRSAGKFPRKLSLSGNRISRKGSQNSLQTVDSNESFSTPQIQPHSKSLPPVPRDSVYSTVSRYSQPGRDSVVPPMPTLPPRAVTITRADESTTGRDFLSGSPPADVSVSGEILELYENARGRLT